jgi:hypothetical protein
VKEVADHPDYEAALSAARGALEAPRKSQAGQ